MCFKFSGDRFSGIARTLASKPTSLLFRYALSITTQTDLRNPVSVSYPSLETHLLPFWP